jgi:hypothetical protein
VSDIVREPVTEALRFLGPQTERGRVHRGVLFVQWVFKREVAVVSAATGRVSRADLRDVLEELQAEGCRQLLAFRPKGRSLPCGLVLMDMGDYQMWAVDINAALAVDAMYAAEVLS